VAGKLGAPVGEAEVRGVAGVASTVEVPPVAAVALDRDVGPNADEAAVGVAEVGPGAEVALLNEPAVVGAPGGGQKSTHCALGALTHETIPVAMDSQ